MKSSPKNWKTGRVQVANLFKSPEALGKAKKKKLLQVLQNSPRKRFAVMESVNADNGLKTNKCPRIDGNAVNQAVRQRAHDF